MLLVTKSTTDEMGGAYGTQWTESKCTQRFGWETGSFEDLHVDGRAALKWILKK
jgi:hypothetical protein